MRRLVLVCWFALACHAGGAGAPTPEVAPTPHTLRYRPDTAHFALSGQRRVEQEFQGQVSEQTSRLQAWISTMLGALASDTLAARIVLDSVSTTGNVFQAGDLSGIRGATWTARLAPTGELVDMQGPSQAGLASQMFNTLATFFPRMPAAGLTVGDAWVDTVTSTVDVGGVELTIRTVNHNEAMGPRMWGGQDAFLVQVLSEYTLNGEGSQGGQPLALDGQGRRHTLEYLTPDGRYLGNTVADTSNYDIVLTAMGMSIPGRQWRYDTLRASR